MKIVKYRAGNTEWRWAVKVTMEYGPLNKASSETGEICNPGILARVPGKDGSLSQ